MVRFRISIVHRIILFVFIFFLGTALSGCVIEAEEVELANESVIAFRDAVRRHDYESVFNDASSGFRAMADKAVLEKLLERLNPSISDPSQASLIRSDVRQTLFKPTLVALTYGERGKILEEEFVFIREGDRYRLENYRVDEIK